VLDCSQHVNLLDGLRNELRLAPSPQKSRATLASVLIVHRPRVAAHGAGEMRHRCRCSGARPCADEHQIADLLELTGGACR